MPAETAPTPTLTPSASRGPQADVAILGSGIAGSMLACILARKGLSVVLIDNGMHPRFALGESTIGETSYLMRLMACRYDVPEIWQCSSIDELRANVSGNCGVKKNFGFAYHREGVEHRPEQNTQCNVSAFPFGPEMHLHRQDIDAHLFYAAIRYGAKAMQRTSVSGVEIGADGVTLSTASGETVRARYLCDASGQNSVLAQQFDLREQPARFKTHSRTLFTHMVGVRPFDECVDHGGQPTAWHQGTLHHIFDGGWMWVIPFDNHDKSTNPLCSVGLSFDSRRSPRPTDITPQQEWDAFLTRFPAVQRQFADARPVWNWVSTPRTQFSSKRTVGDRWCLMSHAAGAIDALFSRGMANSLQVVNQVAATLLSALDENDLSAARFAHIDRLNQGILDYNDRLIHGSYVSFRHFDLWRAWSKVWFLSWHLSGSRISGALFRYLETGDKTHLAALDTCAVPGSFAPDLPEFDPLFDQLTGIADRVEAGQMEALAAVGAISDTFAASPVSPAPLNLPDVLRQYHDGSLAAQRRMHAWGRSQAPAPLRPAFAYDLERLVQSKPRYAGAEGGEHYPMRPRAEVGLVGLSG